MTFKSKNYLFLAIVLFNVIFDQVTKQLAKRLLEQNFIYTYFFDILRLIYVENSGVAYSFGADWAPHYKFIVFNLIVTAIVAALIIYVYKMMNELSPMRLIGFSLIVTGGVGNLIDRYLRDGHVIDFLNIGLGGIRTAIFNWADFCISTGIVMLFIYALTELRSKPKTETETEI